MSRLFIDVYARSPIKRLLSAVAYGNLDRIKEMLNEDPELLLQSGDVSDPAGNLIRAVYPYPCALGTGDDEAAEVIAGYFANIKEGAAVGERYRLEQSKAYQQHIEEMTTMLKGFHARSVSICNFDFWKLSCTIFNSTEREVRAALDLNFNHESKLANALEDMRVHFSPRDIKGGMHCNMMILLEALSAFQHARFRMREAENKRSMSISASEETSFSMKDAEDMRIKCVLFMRLVFGYLQLGLSACDRMVLAQGLVNIIDRYPQKKELFRRSYFFRNAGRRRIFPDKIRDNARSDLGYECAVDIRGNILSDKWWASTTLSFLTEHENIEGYFDVMRNLITKYLTIKYDNLARIVKPKQKEHSVGCRIC